MSFLNLPPTSLQQWEQIFTASLSRAALPKALYRSWSRSLSHEVNPKRSTEEPIAYSSTVRERQEALAPLMKTFSDRFAPLAQTLSSQHFKLLLTDAEGIIVEEWGGGEFADEAEKLRLIKGSMWSEELRGTNAIGTAIAERCPVAVHSTAHFVEAHHQLVCYAAPVFDVDGQILGVIDATSFAQAAHPSIMASIQSVAKALEEWLRLGHWQNHAAVRTHVLERLLSQYPGPALLVEPTGIARMANQQALQAFPHLQNNQIINNANHTRLYTIKHPLQELLDLSPTTLCNPQQRESYVELSLSERYKVEVEPLFDGPTSPLIYLFQKLTHAKRPTKATTQPPTKRKEADVHEAFSGLLGEDPAFRSTLSKASRLARSKLPLLLQSETGTGKEMLARAIHLTSPRANKPFVALNCAALTQELLTSELFGYAPNAFTGAAPKGKSGHIAAADGGTLFLDEIAETSPSFQAMLLRLLEDGSYYPVGDTTLRHADVRILCASCRKLQEMINDGHFRRDLFYRIRGTILRIPPVRQRTDFALLTEGLLQQIAKELELPECPSLSQDALHLLQQHDWPGNVRELRHVLHCATVLAEPTSPLTPSCLEDLLPIDTTTSPPNQQSTSPNTKSMEDSKLTAIQRALEQTKGNVSAAARMLGVARSTIYRMIRRQQEDETP